MTRMASRKMRSALWATAIVLGLFGAWQWHERHLSGIPKSDHYCEVEVLARPTVGNAHFEIVDVACDTLAKDETIRIYGLSNHRSFFGGSKNVERLLFSYDPGTYPSEPSDLPQIAETPDATLTISAARVSEILFKSSQWNGKQIRYQIGRVDYASPWLQTER